MAPEKFKSYGSPSYDKYGVTEDGQLQVRIVEMTGMAIRSAFFATTDPKDGRVAYAQMREVPLTSEGVATEIYRIDVGDRSAELLGDTSSALGFVATVSYPGIASVDNYTEAAVLNVFPVLGPVLPPQS